MCMFCPKPLPPSLLSHQVLWRWSSPPSQSPRILATRLCCAARSPVTRRLSSVGRRTGRTYQWPLTPNLAWLCCRLARCRSAVSSLQTRPRTAVWLTTLAAPGRGRMPSSECFQVREMRSGCNRFTNPLGTTRLIFHFPISWFIYDCRSKVCLLWRAQMVSILF